MHHQGEREDRSWAFLNTIYGQDRKLVEHYLMHAYMKYDNVYIYIYTYCFLLLIYLCIYYVPARNTISKEVDIS